MCIRDRFRSISRIMKRFTEVDRWWFRYIFVILALGSYAALFAKYHSELGTGIASLATIPVIAASWYFGIQGGVAAAVFCIAVSTYLQVIAGLPVNTVLS